MLLQAESEIEKVVKKNKLFIKYIKLKSFIVNISKIHIKNIKIWGMGI